MKNKDKGVVTIYGVCCNKNRVIYAGEAVFHKDFIYRGFGLGVPQKSKNKGVVTKNFQTHGFEKEHYCTGLPVKVVPKIKNG